MDGIYPTISKEDEQDILTRFLTWIMDDPTAETFILITEGGHQSRIVEMTTEQEVKELIQTYLDHQLDQGCAADERIREQRLER